MARPMLFALVPLLALALSACASVPEPARRPMRTVTTWNPPAAPDGRMCLTNLSRSDADFTQLPDQYYGAGCSAVGAVRLASLRSDGGVLQLSNLGPVTCPLANTLSGWARFGVDRAARAMLGSPLVRIETMGSYACRNVAGTNRLSGHASANAVDVAGFVLVDGRRISVLRDWDNPSPQIRAFLGAVRDSACKRFGTALSPQYNAAHRDHLHLEVGGGRPFCR
ncbi:extensin family protein [Novosphingobium sp. PASSN1]|uniref:extensin family protein n=1 Tax=Novosphingobium sp. PASSN1 TaxID=2015561 RepID=UPI000BCFF429|nr:extensin family protein [Novosphingobium sp. PASSN1]OYU35094.1 MAG: extensin [Novosphingobium sp. PASSN1]